MRFPSSVEIKQQIDQLHNLHKAMHVYTDTSVDFVSVAVDLRNATVKLNALLETALWLEKRNLNNPTTKG